MPVKTKTKKQIDWIQVFFFFVISSLGLLAVTMISLIALNAIRPDLGDKLRIAVASKMLQEDFQTFIDDRSKIAETAEAVAAKDAKITELQSELEAMRKQSQLPKEKSGQELSEPNQTPKETEKPKVIATVKDDLERFFSTLRMSLSTVASGSSTADKIEFALLEKKKLDTWIQKLSGERSLKSIEGHLKDILPGKEKGMFTAVVQPIDNNPIGNSDLHVETASLIDVTISANEKARLRINDRLSIHCFLVGEMYANDGRSEFGRSVQVDLLKIRFEFASRQSYSVRFFVEEAKIANAP